MALEIERKFIILLPADIMRLPHKEIEQTYLVSDRGTKRVRAMESENVKEYYFTEKYRLTNATCEERECAITAEQYEAYLRQADPCRQTICKTRYYYEYRGQRFEIDVYPFWKKQCIMEIELQSEGQTVVFPPDITVIQDVTDDYSYKNAALAKAVPPESV